MEGGTIKMNERETLLKRIDSVQFAAHELSLFLNTHPNDMESLEKMRKYQDIYMQLKSEFESKYGPLTINSASQDKTWEWTQNPWPWDKEGN